MITLLKTLNQKKFLAWLGGAIILLFVGLIVFLALAKKPPELYLPVVIDEASKEQINQRISKNLEMLKLFPNDYNVYLDLGNLARQLGQASQAIGYYKKAWEIIPANSTPWLNIGNIYIELGDYQSAEQAFLKAKAVNPNYYFTYFNLAKLYKDFLKTKADQIRPVYLEGLKNTNNDYQLLQFFSDYLVETANYSEALSYLKALLQKIPSGGRQQILDRIKEVENLMAQSAP